MIHRKRMVRKEMERKMKKQHNRMLQSETETLIEEY